MSENAVNPIVADPQRQAIGSQGGYSYQAWQSVYQWITLKSGETLFLEGGEDIDVLKSGEARTIQVKQTQAAVTLNSSDVLEAIGHFWEHQTNNPELTIWFHFLTTSHRGQEQGNPFGASNGLDHWDACKRDAVSLDSLRSFLHIKTQLPSELLAFLNSATDDELRKKLVRRILWDTDKESQSYLEKLIEGILIEHGTGAPHYLPPSESLKVLPHLLKQVWDVVCQEHDRRLNYSDFARLFEEVTTERVPLGELRELRLTAQAVGRFGLGSLAGGSTQVTSIALTTTDRVIEPPRERLAERPVLTNELRTRLLENGLLVLRGSTSMGKSTLAALIAGRVTDAKWSRLDLRGLQPEFVRERLLFASSTYEQQSFAENYLIDDLNFENRPDVYENSLAALIYVVRKRGGTIMITTQGEFSSRVRLLFDLPEDCSFDVPLLTEDEIREIAQKYNCPSGQMLDSWTNLVAANTGGHPLLVHAQIKNIQVAGWPKPTAKDLLPPKSVEAVRTEVRRRLQDLLPSDSARTLAYRLSVFTGYFKRTNALYLAEHPSPLVNPGEAFDLLVGPWVERISDKYYRLSPLLSGSANEMLPGGMNELHGFAAVSYLNDLSWTPHELWGALFHGILGDAMPALVTAIAASLQVETENWPSVSRRLELLCYIKVMPNEKLLSSDPFLSLMLRWLQFRIAAEVNPVKVGPMIAKRWGEEVEQFDEKAAYPGSKLVGQFLFANHTLLRLDVPLPMAMVVRNLAMTLSSVGEGIKHTDNPLLSQTFGRFAEVWGDSEFFATAAVNRCRTERALAEFNSSISDLSGESIELVWSQFRENDYLAMLLIDSAWLSESKLESPNWPQCLATFDAVAKLALQHSADSIVVAAYRAKAIVFREYLSDSRKAHESLDDGKDKLGREHLLLQDYRAKIFSLDEDFDEAISIWKSIESELERTEIPSRVFTYRDAEIAAAGINDWNGVAKLALKAEQAARSSSFKEALAVGFHTDYAFALWMAGAREPSISAFIDVVDMLGGLGSPEEDLTTYTLHRKVSHVISWLKQETQGGDKVFKPPAAWFSSQASHIEATEPVNPDLNFWYTLAEIEARCCAGDLAFKRFEQTAAADNPLFQAAVAKLRLVHALRRQPPSGNLIAELGDFFTKLRACAEAFGTTPPDWKSHADLVVPFLFTGFVVACSSRNYPTAAVVKEWREDAERLHLRSESLTNWLDVVELWSHAEESELIASMKDSSARTEIRVLAALLLSTRDAIDPESLFYANVALLTTPNIFGLWAEGVETFVSDIICEAWSRVTKHQRFAVQSPNLTVPAIMREFDSETIGFQKAASVVVAARHAVQTGLDDSLLLRLEEMSASAKHPASIGSTP